MGRTWWSEAVVWWRSVTHASRLAVVGGAMLCIAVLCVGASLSRDQRIALFATPLDAAQLNEVDAHLAAWGVAHMVTSDNILIAADLRNETLLRLALIGSPHAHLSTSSEMLAHVGALTPESVVQAQSRTGLAGDLALALRSVDGVADATVLIAPAVPAIFPDEAESAATASVRLSLRVGAELSPDVVQGIRSFVAGGVPGLQPDHVMILDDHGLALGSAVMNGGENAETLRATLQQSFDLAFGRGSTIVQVRVERDGAAHAIHEVRRQALDGPTLQRQGEEEHFHQDRRSYSRITRNEERGTLLHDETITLPLGRAMHLSVAVLVDERRHLNLDRLRALAAAGLGLDTLHGDTLVVEAVAFPDQTPVRLSTGSMMLEAVAPVLPVIVFGLLGTLLLALSMPYLTPIVRQSLAGMRWRRPPIVDERYPPHEIHRLLRDEPPHAAAALLGQLPAHAVARVLELFSTQQREAIAARLARPTSSCVPTLEDFFHAS